MVYQQQIMPKKVISEVRHTLFFDSQKTCDTTDRNKLLKELEVKGTREDLLGVIQEFYGSSAVCGKWNKCLR